MALGTPFSVGTLAQTGAGLTSAQVTVIAPVAAGSCLIVAVAFDTLQPNVVVSDSAGNVYQAAADVQVASALTVQLFSCLNCKALPLFGTITVSLPGGTVNVNGNLVPVGSPANYLYCAAAAVTGVGFPGALDATSIASNVGTAPTSGTALAGQAAEALFAAVAWFRTAAPGTTETVTWGGTFAGLSDTQKANGTVARAGLFLGYRVVAASGSYTATATLSNSDTWAALLAGYRAESDFAGGAVFVNGVPLTSGRTDLTPSGSVNRIEIRGVADADGRLYTDANAQPQLQVNNAAAASVLATASMDYRGPGWWALDVADTVWVHAAGPWAHTLTVENAAVSKLLATYRFTTSDPQN